MTHVDSIYKMLGAVKMTESEAQISRHLAASRYYLPERLPSDSAKAAWARVEHQIHCNELKGALDTAMALGNEIGAEKEYWRELLLAVRNMELDEHAGKLAELVRAQQGE
jgi:hypothetical protein